MTHGAPGAPWAIHSVPQLVLALPSGVVSAACTCVAAARAEAVPLAEWLSLAEDVDTDSSWEAAVGKEPLWFTAVPRVCERTALPADALPALANEPMEVGDISMVAEPDTGEARGPSRSDVPPLLRVEGAPAVEGDSCDSTLCVVRESASGPLEDAALLWYSGEMVG